MILADSRIIYERLEWFVISLSSTVDIVNLKRYFSDILVRLIEEWAMSNGEKKADTFNTVNDHFVRESENQFILQLKRIEARD